MTVSSAVKHALSELALDLKLAQGANQSADVTKRLILRTVDAYDARLKAAGYAEDGLTKLAGDDDMLTKALDRVAELEKRATPGGPVSVRPQRAPAAPSLADRYLAKAEQTTDPVLRRGYTELARKHAQETT